MTFIRNIFLIVVYIGVSQLCYGQIKTVQLFNPQTNDHTPVINLGEKLIFSFDELNKGYQAYDYKIIRYDRNWNPSNIFTSEFLRGSDKNRIRNYKSSFNTRVRYTDYKVEIPNKDFNFLLSGNYAIQVLKPYSNTPIIEKRFFVVQPLSDIGVSVERINNNHGKNQRVSVIASSEKVDFLKSTDIQLLIFKNNNFNESIAKESATFTQPHQLIFKPLDTDFNGGTEYQFFDTKNTEVPALTTERIIRDSIFKTVLYPNNFNPDGPYVDRPDIDGDFYIRNTQFGSNNASNDSDYTDVYFALADYNPEPNEEICIYGAFNDYKCEGNSILKFNPDTNLWETNLLLKQGYYNYNFASKINNKIDYTKITGSYWQTENRYGALLYMKPWGKRYDLIIGYGEGYSKPPYR